MSQGVQGQSPMNYGGYSRPQYGFNRPQYGGYNGYIPPQMPIFPGQSTTSEGGWTAAGRPRQGIPQMSTGYSVNEPMPQTGGSFNPMVGSQMQPTPQMSQPFQSTQQQAPMQQARPQQSFEDFASTLSGSGMTSGQMNDLYQKQLAKASAPAPTNFWQNVGPGGTQNPFPQSPQPFPSQWGNQTFNFDPKSMAGKQVTGDLGWYYGRDAIGRQINNQGDAVAGFSSPADGFQRSRPWFG